MAVQSLLKRLATAGKTLWPGTNGQVPFEGGTYIDQLGNIVLGGSAILQFASGIKGFIPDTAIATAVAGAETSNHQIVLVTTESLTTAAGSTYTNTLTNSLIAGASSIVWADVWNGTNTAAGPLGYTVTPAAGSVAVAISNRHASAALNGTLQILIAVIS